MGLSGFDEALDANQATISGGMVVRIVVGEPAIGNALVMLAGPPLAALDPPSGGFRRRWVAR